MGKMMQREKIEVLTVNSEAGVITARESVKKIAASMGFDKYDQHRIATALSELAENSLRYAGGGTVEIRRLERGLEITCRDSGRGMMQEKNVKGGLGIGLKSVENLMDETLIETGSQGTCVRIRKWLK
jgi:anti-sigma regulatory factor (Ser/Thr protein kinase)